MSEEPFKIFISWSGKLSLLVAKQLESWLNTIFDSVQPWVSDTNIESGARTYDTIAAALTDSRFGIIVTTKDNQNAPWLNYEAGALSNMFGVGRQTRVAPLLVDFESQGELTSPIKQFQNNILHKAGVTKLCQTIASVVGADWDYVLKRVDAFWGEFHDGVEAAKAQAGSTPPTKPRSHEETLLDEIVATVRRLDRNLTPQITAFSEMHPRNVDDVRPKPLDRTGAQPIAMRLSPEMIEVLKHLAAQEGQTLSGYLRILVENELRSPPIAQQLRTELGVRLGPPSAGGDGINSAKILS